MRRKYRLNEAGPMVISHKHRASPIWRGFEWASTLLTKGTRWRVQDGRRVRFWEDNWLNDRPLSEGNELTLQATEVGAAVRDYWVEGRGWNWEVVGDKLSHSNLMKLASHTLRNGDLARDQMG